MSVEALRFMLEELAPSANAAAGAFCSFLDLDNEVDCRKMRALFISVGEWKAFFHGVPFTDEARSEIEAIFGTLQ